MTTYILASMVVVLLAAVITLAIRVHTVTTERDDARADYRDAVDREEQTHQFLEVVGRQFYEDQP